MVETIVIINGSGRSGTTNLFKSFEKICKSQHCHNFNIKELGPGIYKGKKVIECVRSEINNNYVFIDVHRDFIDRKMSVFFHNVIELTGRNKEQFIKLYNNTGLKKISKMFRNFLVSDAHSGLVSESWNKEFGYDIYETKFDLKKKIQFKKIDNFTFLNLNFKDINNWEKIIKNLDVNIKNIENFKLVGKKQIRWSDKIYKELKKNFKLFEWDFNLICKKNEKILNHFYDLDSLKKFKNKWEKKIIKRTDEKLYIDQIIEKKINQ